MLKGHPREGEPLLREALALWMKPRAPYEWRVAQAEQDLADCLERQGRIEEARPLYQSARDRYCALFSPDSRIARDANQHLERLPAVVVR